MSTVPSPVEPLARQYLLSVATGGLYLSLWAYRVARRLDPVGRVDRVRAATWAMAVWFAPAACALLYETSRLARGEAAARGVRARTLPLLSAPLLYAGLGGGLLLSRFGPLWAPFLLLLPVPFLLAQADLNRLSEAGAATRRWHARVAWAIVAAGLPGAAFLLYRIDGKALPGILSARALDEGATIEGRAAAYRLRAPSGGWVQVGPGTVGDGGEDLGLQKSGGALWLVSYVVPASGASLDGAVGIRRGLIAGDGQTVTAVEERRFFREGADMVPASFARYSVRGANQDSVYLVLTTTFGDQQVEIIAAAGGANGDQEDLRRLVTSLAPRETPGADARMEGSLAPRETPRADGEPAP